MSTLSVRIVIEVEGSNTYSRDYVRTQHGKIGKQRFVEQSIGNLAALVLEDHPNQQPNLKISVQEIDYTDVLTNRQYHHTSH